jgi:hypothetical protein
LQFNHTLTHRRGVIVLILSDYEIHGTRCRAAVSLNQKVYIHRSCHFISRVDRVPLLVDRATT